MILNNILNIRYKKKLKDLFEEKYLNKLSVYDNLLEMDIIDSKLSKPQFLLYYNNYNLSYFYPFKYFKYKVLLNRYVINKVFDYEDFNDSFIDELLYYTNTKDERNTKVESLLKLFIPDDFYSKDFKYCNLFVDYGLTTINDKEYTFIKYTKNFFLSDIFFNKLSDAIISINDYDNIVFIDFNDKKLKYYYTEILPILKSLIKLYKDKII